MAGCSLGEMRWGDGVLDMGRAVSHPTIYTETRGKRVESSGDLKRRYRSPLRPVAGSGQIAGCEYKTRYPPIRMRDDTHVRGWRRS